MRNLNGDYPILDGKTVLLRCGSILKPDDTVDICSEPMKIYQVIANDNEEYFRERKNAEEYLKQCGGGKLIEIILKDTVKE